MSTTGGNQRRVSLFGAHMKNDNLRQITVRLTRARISDDEKRRNQGKEPTDSTTRS